MLDLVGLVDPAVVAARREGRLAERVAARDPAYLLVPTHFRPGLLDPLLAHPGIARRYRPAAHFTVPGHSGGTVTFFERHPLRFAPAAIQGAPPPERSVWCSGAVCSCTRLRTWSPMLRCKSSGGNSAATIDTTFRSPSSGWTVKRTRWPG